MAAWPTIFYGTAPNDGTGTSFKGAILPALQRLFTRLTGIGPAYPYSFNSADTANSIFHIPRAELDLGTVFTSLWADTNRNAGGGASWEVTKVNDTVDANGVPTPWVASTGGSIVSGRFVCTGLWAEFTLVPTETKINVAQLFVNTKSGTSMQGRLHLARDLAGVAAGGNRREVIAQGEVTIGPGASDGIDMRTANFDFSDLRLLEPAAGAAGTVLRVGDPDSGGVLGLADFVKSRAVVVGINQAPSATSGPNGTKGFDFQGAPGQQTPGQGSVGATIKPSTVIGALMANCDSVEDREWHVSRCLVGLKIEGNTEKQRIKGSFAVCGIGIQDYTVRGSPDTNYIEASFNLCKQIFVPGEDSTGHLRMNAEARIDDGSSFPAAYNAAITIPTPSIPNSNGKRWKYSGESRAMNGRLHFYIDRFTSASITGQGSDTVEWDDYSTVHQFGAGIVADRVQYMLGTYSAKDNGPGRLNTADDDDATCAQLPGGTFEINAVQKSMAGLYLRGEDIYTEYGAIFGDVTKNLKSIDKRIGSLSIHMRETTGYNGKAWANRDMKVIKGALCIRYGERLYVPMPDCNHDVVLEAGCLDCTVELPAAWAQRNHNEWDPSANGGAGAMVSRPNRVIKDPAASASIIVKGSLTAANLATMAAWAFEGVTVEKVSDRGGRPAAFIGGGWKLPVYGEAL